jgi:hypothetical protein
LYINGVNEGADTSATIPATSKLSFNDFSQLASYDVNAAALWKTRLTNTQLAELTTL